MWQWHLWLSFSSFCVFVPFGSVCERRRRIVRCVFYVLMIHLLLYSSIFVFFVVSLCLLWMCALWSLLVQLDVHSLLIDSGCGQWLRLFAWAQNVIQTCAIWLTALLFCSLHFCIWISGGTLAAADAVNSSRWKWQSILLFVVYLSVALCVNLRRPIGLQHTLHGIQKASPTSFALHQLVMANFFSSFSPFFQTLSATKAIILFVWLFAYFSMCCELLCLLCFCTLFYLWTHSNLNSLGHECTVSQSSHNAPLWTVAIFLSISPECFVSLLEKKEW